VTVSSTFIASVDRRPHARRYSGTPTRQEDYTLGRARGVDLRGAKLRGAIFRGAFLRDVDLRDVDLRGIYLSGADLSGANLRDAILRDAFLGGAILRGAFLHGVDLHGVNLSGADLSLADLSGARWNSRTSWPDELAAEIREASDEQPDGSFRVRGGASGERSPTHAPVS